MSWITDWIRPPSPPVGNQAEALVRVCFVLPAIRARLMSRRMFSRYRTAAQPQSSVSSSRYRLPGYRDFVNYHKMRLNESSLLKYVKQKQFF